MLKKTKKEGIGKGQNVKFNRSVYQALTMIGQFGINMLVPVFICAFLGMYLDRKLGTNFLMIILFFIGAVAGGYNVYRFSRQVYQKNSEESAYLHKGRRKDRKHCERENHKNKQKSV